MSLVEQLTSYFINAPIAERPVRLVQLASYLTIAMRETYTCCDISVVTGINELQHAITNHLVGILTHSNEIYPDDVLVSHICELAIGYGVQEILAGALGHCKVQ